MDLTLSKRGDYVMRSAIALAKGHDAGVARKIREIVADTEVPATFASQILADLVRAGLATSKAGRAGGFRLSRSPDQITVLEVIEAGEGPLHAERCALGDGPCRWDAVCPLHATWTEATVALRELLARTSLAEVAARDTAITAGSYPVPDDSHRLHPSAYACSDHVQVELSFRDAQVALARVAGHLGSVLAGSLGAAADGKQPSRSARPRPAPVEVSLAPVAADDPATEDSARYLLAWRIGGARACRFEADATVAALDADRSELRVEGTWHDEYPAPVRTERERETRQILRAFLRRLASQLERPAPSRRPTRARR
ncbi:MAG TPA: Rrf2 family transcriptional regulator [Acidimicrobiales bacterium]|nr:Rrf2 family transcriptional regulator [Acidimicrobiales bacterium]